MGKFPRSESVFAGMAVTVARSVVGTVGGSVDVISVLSARKELFFCAG